MKNQRTEQLIYQSFYGAIKDYRYSLALLVG